MNNLFVAIVYVVCIIDIMFLEKYVVQTNAVEKSFGKMFFNRYFFDPLIPRIKNQAQNQHFKIIAEVFEVVSELYYFVYTAT